MSVLTTRTLHLDTTDADAGGTASTAQPTQWDTVNRMLSMARRHLDMDVAWLSHFTDGQQVIRATSGDATASMNVVLDSGAPAEATFCLRILAGTLPSAIPDARVHPVTRDLVITRELGIGSYIGVPWTDEDGEVMGTLCCLSQGPTPWLDDQAVDFLQLMAELISDQMGAQIAPNDEQRGADREYMVEIVRRRAFRTVFQPIVSLTDDSVVGYEALSRFDDDRFPSPAHMFALAARVGLGTDLEYVAVERAFEHLADIPEELGLGVNLSASAVVDPDVQALLLAHADRQIGIELTELTQISDYGAFNTALAPLREAGISIIVDDAGAGFASLQHIAQIRPDVIKLDMDLVRDVNVDPVRAALTRSLVAFADEMGAALVAEGIETFAEHAALIALGVTLGQGYFMATPSALEAC